MNHQQQASDTGASPQVIALIGGRLVDGTGAPPSASGVILIEHGVLTRLAPDGATEIPPGAEIVHCEGQSILPGLIDSHTHVERDIPDVLGAFLRDGVTSIGNTGSGPQLVPQLRAAGREPGAARTFLAGPAITAPGGYPVIRGDGSAARGVDSLPQAVAAVDELAALGVDFIKITQEPFDFDFRHPGHLPVLEPELIKAVARRAAEHGLPVRSHVHHADQLEVALAAGVTSVEHLLFPLPPDVGHVELQRTGALHLSALPDLARQLDAMVEQGIYLVPTIGNELAGIRMGLPELGEAALREIEAFMVAVLARFVAAGGTVALGSDWVGLPGVPPGLPRGELRYLLAAGLSPLQVIESATRHAAAVCGQRETLGVLAPGRRADLLVVGGDPSTDLAALDDLRLIVKDGRIVHRADAPEVPRQAASADHAAPFRPAG